MMNKTFRDLLEYLNNYQDDTVILGKDSSFVPAKLGIFELNLNVFSTGDIVSNDAKSNANYFSKLGLPENTVTDDFLVILMDSGYNSNCLAKVTPTVKDWKTFLSKLPDNYLDQPILIYRKKVNRVCSLNLAIKDKLGFGKAGIAICFALDRKNAIKWDDYYIAASKRSSESLEDFQNNVVPEWAKGCFDRFKYFGLNHTIMLSLDDYYGKMPSLEEEWMIPDFAFNPESYNIQKNRQELVEAAVNAVNRDMDRGVFIVENDDLQGDDFNF